MDISKIDHQQLAYFYWVATFMNFTKAAQVCQCSKSHISKAVTQLERDLKTKLLQRTTRQIELTESGEYLFIVTKDMMQQLQDGLGRLQEITNKPHGHLKISAPPALAEILLAPMLAKFYRQYPEITIQCRCESRVVDIIKECYDLVFRNATLEDANFIARHLIDIQYICVTGKNMQKQLKHIKTPKDIKNFPTFAYDMPGGIEWIFKKDTQQQHITLKPILTSNLSTMVLSVLESSKGIAVLPDFLIKDALKKKEILQVLPEWHLKEIPLYLIYPSKEYIPLKTRMFIEFIMKSFNK